MSSSTYPEQAAQQQKTATEEKIVLPQDYEGKLSVLLYAVVLHLQKENTELSYTHEIDTQKIRGLTRIPRNVERSNNEWLATHQRLYGPISQLSWSKRVTRPPNYILGLFVFFSVLAVLSYLTYYPQAYQGFLVWWHFYGSYATIGAIMGLAVMLAFVYARRRRRKL